MSTCNQVPVQFVNCCDVMNCMSIASENNTVEVTVEECGVNLEITPNTLDNLLTIESGECIQMVKEFIDGKLVITPIIDWDCVASHVCDICAPVSCLVPSDLEVIVTP